MSAPRFCITLSVRGTKNHKITRSLRTTAYPPQNDEQFKEKVKELKWELENLDVETLLGSFDLEGAYDEWSKQYHELLDNMGKNWNKKHHSTKGEK